MRTVALTGAARATVDARHRAAALLRLQQRREQGAARSVWAGGVGTDLGSGPLWAGDIADAVPAPPATTPGMMYAGRGRRRPGTGSARPSSRSRYGYPM